MPRPKAFDRDEALLSAVRAFWEEGFEGASLDRLTQAMGISRSSLYESFGDKASLYHEAIHRYVEVYGLRGTQMLHQEDGHRALVEYLDGAITMALDAALPGGCMCVSAAATSHCPTVKEKIREDADHLVELLAHAVRRGQAQGTISADRNAEDVARHFVGLEYGISVLARLDLPREFLESIAHEGVRTLAP